ncbi:MAG: hypothetical protein E3J35_07735 [Methanomassiliicoccales archaeon]|nr:MAG: hypothetical protein E3J35_07735 [Methanomassiliicoccales archaeon]
MIDLEETLRIAQLELEEWKSKQIKLEEELSIIEEEERGTLAEIDRVDTQIAYYDSLESDMKKELEPPKLSGMLSSLRKG